MSRRRGLLPSPVLLSCLTKRHSFTISLHVSGLSGLPGLRILHTDDV
jgi:hypothetical protein